MSFGVRVKQHTFDSESRVGVNVKRPSRLIGMISFWGFKMKELYMEHSYCLFCWLNRAQLISTCKQSPLLGFWDAGVQSI